MTEGSAQCASLIAPYDLYDLYYIVVPGGRFCASDGAARGRVIELGGGACDDAISLRHRILRGSKPSDLPVELPVKYRFVINLTTAKAIGLDVPDDVISIADEVIG